MVRSLFTFLFAIGLLGGWYYCYALPCFKSLVYYQKKIEHVSTQSLEAKNPRELIYSCMGDLKLLSYQQLKKSGLYRDYRLKLNGSYVSLVEFFERIEAFYPSAVVTRCLIVKQESNLLCTCHVSCYTS